MQAEANADATPPDLQQKLMQHELKQNYASIGVSFFKCHNNNLNSESVTHFVIDKNCCMGRVALCFDKLF